MIHSIQISLSQILKLHGFSVFILHIKAKMLGYIILLYQIQRNRSVFYMHKRGLLGVISGRRKSDNCRQ